MSDRINRLRRGAVTGATTLLGAAVLAGCADQDNQQTSLDPKGPDAQQILDLFSPFFWIAVVIGVGVVGGTIYVALRFREKPGQPRAPKQVHGNTALEVGWTIVPALILVVMAVPTVATIFDLAEKPGEGALTVEVVGKQWWWEYEYVGEGVVTANELHIPVDRPVELRISAPADGVIHSFWVPNLAGKKDAVPGRSHFLRLEASEPGTYFGQCAEYCGLSHADMRLRVIAQPADEFEAWLAAQKEPLPATDAQFVRDVLTDSWGCTGCHRVDVAGTEPADIRTGPNLTHLGDRTSFGAGLYDTTVDELTEWVYDAPARKPFGPLDPLKRMPSFREGGMTREQARQIAEFLCTTATDPANERRCLGGSGEAQQ
jgi:cytochrome c oxidase subunit 2